jgi:hypothetical protein
VLFILEAAAILFFFLEVPSIVKFSRAVGAFFFVSLYLKGLFLFHK